MRQVCPEVRSNGSAARANRFRAGLGIEPSNAAIVSVADVEVALDALA